MSRIIFNGRIISEFTGYQPGMIFELDDGTGWQQIDDKVWNHKENMPFALIVIEDEKTILKIVGNGVWVEKLE